MMKEAKFAKWAYYVNAEGKARWRCSGCGKIVKKHPYSYQKWYCSRCGAKMQFES